MPGMVKDRIQRGIQNIRIISTSAPKIHHRCKTKTSTDSLTKTIETRIQIEPNTKEAFLSKHSS